MMSESNARQTPLHSVNQQEGARFVEFAGWQMPVRYGSLAEEHQAVRERAGLFDVSHMGQIMVSGPGSTELVQRLTPNNALSLTPGRAHYTGFLTERGTYIDDILVYRIDERDWMVVVNASNRIRGLEWIQQHAEGVQVEDHSLHTALMALQGPKAGEILQSLTDTDLSKIRYYRFAAGKVGRCGALISRTGYTGEDGFELYVGADDADEVWRQLRTAGEAVDLRPCGLGARDTLRLEASMALYGNELNDQITPLEADLGWTVKWDAGDFIGRAALEQQKESGIDRKLVGLEILGRGIARHDYPVTVDGNQVGAVTSGTMSPTLGRAIALAYVRSDLTEAGQECEVEVRGRGVEARVCATPFYKRPKPSATG